MVGRVRSGGVTALLLVVAVMLAAAAVPMLSGHTPLEAAGPDSGPEIDGLDADAEEFDAADSPQDVDSLEDSGAGEGLIHDDFAELADDDDIAETMTGLAGLLAMLFDGDGVGGAVGEPTDQEDPEEVRDDLEHTDQDGTGEDGADDEQRDAVDSDDGDETEAVDREDVDADSDDDDDVDGEDTDGANGDDEASDESDAGDNDGADANGDEADADGDGADGDDEANDETAAEHEEETGEDERDDDDLSGAESDVDDPANGESTDDEAVGSETDAGSEDAESIFDRLDPVAIGLGVGGLIAMAVGWFAYRTGRGLLSIVLSIPMLVMGAVTRFVFGITAVVERTSRAVRAASSVLALPRLFVGGVVQSGRDFAAAVRSLFDRGQPTVDVSDVDQLPSEREQIRAAWRAVVDAVGSRQYRRRTAGEIKQRAVDRGLPEQPVSTLVSIFRDVEYGAKDPTGRADQAVSAANELSEPAETADSAESTTSTPDASTDEGGETR